MPSSPVGEARATRASERASGRSNSRWFQAVIVVLVALGAATIFWWFQGGPIARDGAPNWSPDGQSIVFAAEVGERKGDIFVMGINGGGRRQLTDDPANDSGPAMSPDGTEIAFESDRDGNPEIYVMDRDGRNVRRLTNNPAEELAPAWSPDGARIAFTSDRDSRASADVYSMNADGTEPVRLTSDLAHWAPQFSPDGRRLAVQVNQDTWLLDLATREKRRLTVAPQNGMNPTWSPDGARLAFVTTRNRKGEIFTMKADGSDARVLVSMAAGSVIDPRWSPAGTHIAFVMVPEVPDGADPEAADAQQAIYVIELASEKLTRISR